MRLIEREREKRKDHSNPDLAHVPFAVRFRVGDSIIFYASDCALSNPLCFRLLNNNNNSNKSIF